MNDNTSEKLDKLLSLSHSDNIYEARSALDKARRLIQKQQGDLNRPEISTAPSKQSRIVTIHGQVVDLSTQSGRKRWEILRHVEIMEESLDLVNKSSNLSTVITRLDTAISELGWLAKCNDSDLISCKLKRSEQIKAQFSTLIADKPKIITNGIKRAASAAIAHAKTLKTSRGQINHINSFIEESLSLQGLYQENIDALLSLRAALHKDAP